jgi:hypothetical protein
LHKLSSLDSFNWVVDDHLALQRTLTNTRAVVSSLVAVATGCALFAVLRGDAWWERLLLGLAAAVVGTAVLLGVEVWTRRSLATELLRTIKIDSTVVANGLDSVGDTLSIVNFESRLPRTRVIDIAIAGNVSWLNRNFDELCTALDDPLCIARFIIPDASNESVCEEVGRRFRDGREDFILAAQAIEKRLESLLSNPTRRGTVEWRRLGSGLTYSYYRLDHLICVQMFSNSRHADSRGRVTLAFDKAAALGRATAQDFEACWASAGTTA